MASRSEHTLAGEGTRSVDTDKDGCGGSGTKTLTQNCLTEPNGGCTPLQRGGGGVSTVGGGCVDVEGQLSKFKTFTLGSDDEDQRQEMDDPAAATQLQFR